MEGLHSWNPSQLIFLVLNVEVSLVFPLTIQRDTISEACTNKKWQKLDRKNLLTRIRKNLQA